MTVSSNTTQPDPLENPELLKLILEGSELAFWDWDIPNASIQRNLQWAKMLGYLVSEIQPTLEQWIRLIHPEDRKKAERALHNYLRGRKECFEIEYRLRMKSGDYKRVLDRGRIVKRDNLGNPIRMAGIINDVDRRGMLEKALAESEQLFDLFLELSPIYIFFKDNQARPLRLSKNYEKMLGRPIHEILGKTMDQLFPSEMAKKMIQDDLHVLESGQNLEVIEELNGRTFLSTKFPIKKNGKPYILAGFTQDITEQRTAENSAKEANLRLKKTISDLERYNQEMAILKWLVEMMQLCQSIDETFGIITSALRGLFPGTSGMLGTPSEEHGSFVVRDQWGKPANKQSFYLDDCLALRRRRLFHIDHSMQVFQCKHQLTPGPASSICIPMIVHEEILGLINLSHSSNEDFFDIHTIQVIQAIADSAAVSMANLILRETLRQQAIRDPLTKLFNRRYMEETLEREIKHALRANYAVGLLFLDLDLFKSINDRYGHLLGDKVLRDIGEVLLLNTRGEDIACRYGGDEFVIILPDVNANDLENKANKLLNLVRCLEWNISESETFRIQLSCGSALFPRDSATGIGLIQAADLALYEAKHRGRNLLVSFEQSNHN